jgi:hypothetical protein
VGNGQRDQVPELRVDPPHQRQSPLVGNTLLPFPPGPGGSLHPEGRERDGDLPVTLPEVSVQALWYQGSKTPHSHTKAGNKPVRNKWQAGNYRWR